MLGCLLIVNSKPSHFIPWCSFLELQKYFLPVEKVGLNRRKRKYGSRKVTMTDRGNSVTFSEKVDWSTNDQISAMNDIQVRV